MSRAFCRCGCLRQCFRCVKHATFSFHVFRIPPLCFHSCSGWRKSLHDLPKPSKIRQKNTTHPHPAPRQHGRSGDPARGSAPTATGSSNPTPLNTRGHPRLQKLGQLRQPGTVSSWSTYVHRQQSALSLDAPIFPTPDSADISAQHPLSMLAISTDVGG